MRLAYCFFIVAVIAAIIGMSLGIYMGIVHDHTLAPVHAHVNLLGWASMFLYGLYYRGEPTAAATPLAKAHFGLAAIGLVAMNGALAPMLYGDERFLPVAIVGSLASLAAMLTFLAVVLRRAFAARPAARPARA